MKVINPIEGKVMLDEQHLDIGYYEQENYYTENVVIDEISNEFPKNTKTKEELKRALINYEGSIVLVSHDRDFYKDIVTTVWNCENWII